MKTTQIQLRDTVSLGGGTHIQKALHAISGVNDVVVEGAEYRITVEHEDVDEETLVATGAPAELIPQQAEVLAPSVPPMESCNEKR